MWYVVDMLCYAMLLFISGTINFIIYYTTYYTQKTEHFCTDFLVPIHLTIFTLRSDDDISQVNFISFNQIRRNRKIKKQRFSCQFLILQLDKNETKHLHTFKKIAINFR